MRSDPWLEGCGLWANQEQPTGTSAFPGPSESQLSAFPIMKKGNTAVHAETRSTRRKSNLPPSALSAPPREKKSRRHLSVFSFPNVRFSSVAGVADPGRGAERLSERLFGREPDLN